MYCEKCGCKCPKHSKFCPNCGVQIKKNKRKKKLGGCLIIVFSLFILIAAVVAVGLYFFSGKTRMDGNASYAPEVKNSSIEEVVPEAYRATPPDAESYYEKNSTVVTKINVSDSEDVLSEAEIYDTMTERGFSQFPITSTYTMDGDFYDATDISELSSEKHPVYETYYYSPDGDMWIITVINNIIMANPVSYNLQSGLSVQVLITESDTVTSYDSTTNQFFETVPNESALQIVPVELIDAVTLDGLTVGEIDSYVK